MSVTTKQIQLFMNPESRQLLKIKSRHVLNTVMTDISWSNLRVDPDGYVFIDMDLKEKAEEMGELGFYKTVYVSGFTDPNTTADDVLEALIDEIEKEKAEILRDWEQVKSIFNKRYENTPKEEIPTRRSKAYVLKEIYEDALKSSAY